MGNVLKIPNHLIKVESLMSLVFDHDQFCFLSANIEFLIDSISLFPEPFLVIRYRSKSMNCVRKEAISVTSAVVYF